MLASALPAPGDTGSGLVLAALVSALRSLGKSPEALLASCGLPPADLNNPLVRLQNDAILRVWEKAIEFAGDENLGLLAAARSEPGSFHILDYLVTSAPNLREGLAQGARHLGLLHDLGELAIVEDGELGHLVQQSSSQIPLPRAEADFFLAALAAICHRAVGTSSLFVAAALPHPAPLDRTLARRAFGGAHLEYDAPCARLTLPRAQLDRPCVQADPHLHRILLEYGALLLKERGENGFFVNRVRRLLAGRLPHMLSLEEAAKALGTSARTLRRRLAADDCTYQQLVDNVRHEAAARLLRDHGLSVDEVAARVGMSSVSTFGRAFRRWSGMTPAQFRATSVP